MRNVDVVNVTYFYISMYLRSIGIWKIFWEFVKFLQERWKKFSFYLQKNVEKCCFCECWRKFKKGNCKIFNIDSNFLFFAENGVEKLCHKIKLFKKIYNFLKKEELKKIEKRISFIHMTSVETLQFRKFRNFVDFSCFNCDLYIGPFWTGYFLKKNLNQTNDKSKKINFWTLIEFWESSLHLNKSIRILKYFY